MAAFLVQRVLGWLLPLVCLSFVSSVAQAGWITITNDTNKTIVVQEITESNGQVKRGKPINLLPGEKLREFVPGPTVKKIEVFESHNPNNVSWSGNLNCKEDSHKFSVSSKDGKVTVGPAESPPKK
jgi:hypothetical protein